MKIGRRHRDIAQLLHLEDERVGLVLGIVEATLITAFEQLDFFAARQFPVVLRQTEFLIDLAADRDPVVATRTAGGDELVQAALGLRSQRMSIALQIAIEWR